MGDLRAVVIEVRDGVPTDWLFCTRKFLVSVLFWTFNRISLWYIMLLLPLRSFFRDCSTTLYGSDPILIRAQLSSYCNHPSREYEVEIKLFGLFEYLFLYLGDFFMVWVIFFVFLMGFCIIRWTSCFYWILS